MNPYGAWSGYTMVELLVTLALVGALVGISAPTAAGWRDGAAVRSARDELAAGLAWTRVAAAAHGGATLVLDPVAGRFSTRTLGRTGAAVDLTGRYGVRIDPGTTDPVVFHYDALGIGRLTNRTIRLRRGRAEAGLTVSAYGRYRRW